MIGTGVYMPNFPVPYTTDVVTVYYIEGCPYCNAARAALEEFRYNGAPLKYALFNVNTIAPSREEFWIKINPYLKNTYYNISSLTQHNTFPVVFIKGKFLGGNAELQEALAKVSLK